MSISIILLNYKKSQLTLTCLDSLFAQYKKEFETDEMEVVIIDNDSGDDSLEVISSAIHKKRYKNTTLVANKENEGFGKGCNIGASHAKGEYLLFLNNDTVVMDRGILSMADYLKHNKDVSILGGQLRNADGSLQPSSGDFYTVPKVLMLLLGMQRYGLLDKSPSNIAQVDWVKGGLLMIRRNIFESLNGFDEKIFMYIEDMELCYRAKKKGYVTYFFPDVHILHAEHGSANKTFAIIHIYKNLLYFYKKHRSISEYFIVKVMLVAKAVLLIGIGSILGRAYLKETYYQALKGIV